MNHRELKAKDAPSLESVHEMKLEALLTRLLEQSLALLTPPRKPGHLGRSELPLRPLPHACGPVKQWPGRRLLTRAGLRQRRRGPVALPSTQLPRPIPRP